jgi:hypothetical protein
MSRSIDLFIDAPLDIDELAVAIAKLTGFAFAQAPGRRGLVLTAGDATAELGVHDFIDDRDLLFSRYRYVLSATVTSDRSINESPEAALLRRIFSAVKADHRYPSLLVFDLQHLLDRSEPPAPPPSQPPQPVAP